MIGLAQTYFAIEDAYTTSEKEKAAKEGKEAQERLAVASAELDRVADPKLADKETISLTETLRKAEQDVSRLSSERATLSREMGRIEGALAEVKRRATAIAHEPYAKVPKEELEVLHSEVKKQVAEAGGTIESLRAALEGIKKAVEFFFSKHGSHDDRFSDEEESALRLEQEQKALMEKFTAVSAELEKAESARARAREEMVALEESGREIRRRILDYAQAKAHEEGEVAKAEARQYELNLLGEALERDKMEIVAIVGASAVSYEPLASYRGSKGTRRSPENP
jgi:chromosome segregation ATPase